ncbi:hypothetical protein [Gaiella sp.]|uniref:hypothetical protein n=1 Tax=Gaiella sp. TaxID=2663207 RepID=UPI003265E393
MSVDLESQDGEFEYHVQFAMGERHAFVSLEAAEAFALSHVRGEEGDPALSPARIFRVAAGMSTADGDLLEGFD